MLRKSILLLVIVLFGSQCADAQTDSVKYGWQHNLAATLNLSQVSFTNWAQGGDNALSYVFLVAGKSAQDLENTNWTITYNFAFGQARLGNLGLRKTDDKIDIGSVLTYKVGTYVNPYASVTFLSQFSTGYKYGDTSKTAVSDFLDPAYITQSVGVGYQPTTTLKTRLGVGLRETFTKNYNVYSDDPSTPEIEKTKIEGGLESITELSQPIDSTVLLSSKLQLFAPFKTLDQIIVHWDNALTAKVSKYISTSLIVSLINDRIVTPRTQIKEGLAIGISYVLF
ncbi:MAG TPA: DUF3078 domain-containing protein [Candidatus Kapabacteria bacterium]|nr:DUF3078 domain-containing protein [Candidatus Kapabacteria bacterium]